MPRGKALNSYPAEYWTICERCAVKGEVFELQLTSITKALSLQGQFYAYRGALKKAFDRSMARGGTGAEQEALRQALQFAEVTVCWVDREEREQVHLRYMPRDQTPNSLMLRELLAKGATTVAKMVQADADASAQELLRKLGMGGASGASGASGGLPPKDNEK